MDNIYDKLAKLNKERKAPEKEKKDSNAHMKKGLEDLMKTTKFNKDTDQKPYGKDEKDQEDDVAKKGKKDKQFDDMEVSHSIRVKK